jgi:hypothetical protein
LDELGWLMANHGIEVSGDGGSLLVGHLGGGGLGRIEHGAVAPGKHVGIARNLEGG